MPDSEKDIDDISTLRKWTVWSAVIGTVLWTGYFFAFLIYQSIAGSATPDNWIISMIQEHPAATIGVAMSAISAFCLVTILEIYRGAIEFEALGFKFRGASGPVILWIFCFLAMILSVGFLWDKSSAVTEVSDGLRPNSDTGVQPTPNPMSEPHFSLRRKSHSIALNP